LRGDGPTGRLCRVTATDFSLSPAPATTGAELLARLGLPSRDLGELPASAKRFPDGVA